MNSSRVLMVATAFIVAAIMMGPAASGFADDVKPSPSPATVSVVIPDTSSPTPAPSGSSSRSGSGSGSSSGTSGGSSAGGSSQGGLPAGPLTAPIPPGEATANASGLKLDHDTISVKQWMVAIGNGYTPGENVQFVFYPGAVVVGSYVANASGTVTARFRIPEDMRLGSHIVEATGWASKHVTNKEFTVVSVVAAGGIPLLWWLVVVLAALLVGIASLAVHFRHSIAGWFGGGLQPTGTVP